MKGRRPKPPGEAVGHRRQPEPVLIGGHPPDAALAEPPEHLDGDARAFWRTYVPVMASARMLDVVDVPALEMLSVSYGRWRQAKRAVDTDGLFENTRRGGLKRSTALRIENDARDAFYKLCEQYGMTTLARIRLGLGELQRRSLQQELMAEFGPLKLEVVDGTAEGP